MITPMDKTIRFEGGRRQRYLQDLIENGNSGISNSSSNATINPTLTPSLSPTISSNTTAGGTVPSASVPTATFPGLTLVLLLILMVFTSCYACVKIARQNSTEDDDGDDEWAAAARRRRNEQQANQRQGSRNGRLQSGRRRRQSSSFLQHPKSRLTTEERVQLYNQTFENNGQQVVLTSKHIQKNTETVTKAATIERQSSLGINNNDNKVSSRRSNGAMNGLSLLRSISTMQSSVSDSTVDTPSSSSGFLVFEKIEKKKMDGNIVTTGSETDDASDSSVNSTSLDRDGTVNEDIKGGEEAELQRRTIQNKNVGLASAAPYSTTSRTCAICLDPMDVGETVVYSEHPDCRHVYHKDCMVHALAYAKPTKRRRRSHVTNAVPNPCPECRRNFCTTPLDQLYCATLSHNNEMMTNDSSHGSNGFVDVELGQ